MGELIDKTLMMNAMDAWGNEWMNEWMCVNKRVCDGLGGRSGTFHRDVLDGEAEDDGPDHSQGHLGVAVDDLCRRGRSHSVWRRDITDGDLYIYTPAYVYYTHNEWKIINLSYDNTIRNNAMQESYW